MSLVGLTGEPVTLNTCDDIIYKEVTVKGTTGRLMWKTWYQMDRLLASGRFDPREVITHRFSLADFDEAFALATSAKAGKILFDPLGNREWGHGRTRLWFRAVERGAVGVAF